MIYDPNNVFAKMLRGEIKCDVVLEGAHFFAFNDMHPNAPVHILIIPKGQYMNVYDFHKNASDEEIVGFYQGVNQTIEKVGLMKKGVRLISNMGEYGQQSVFHFHVHILGGKKLGAKLVSS